MKYTDHPPLSPRNWDRYPAWIVDLHQPQPEPVPPTTLDDVRRYVAVGDTVYIGRCVTPMIVRSLVPCDASTGYTGVAPHVHLLYKHRDNPVETGGVHVHVISGQLLVWHPWENYYDEVLRPLAWHRKRVREQMAFARYLRDRDDIDPQPAATKAQRAVTYARELNRAAVHLAKGTRQMSIFEVPS